MKKNKGVLTLLVTVLVIAALGFVAIWGIGTEKAGSAAGIRQGLDLAGGVSITYQVVGEENPSVEDIELNSCANSVRVLMMCSLVSRAV